MADTTKVEKLVTRTTTTTKTDNATTTKVDETYQVVEDDKTGLKGLDDFLVKGLQVRLKKSRTIM